MDPYIWHLHVHVLPRYRGDELYRRHLDAAYTPAAHRVPYAEELAAYLDLPTTFV